MSAIAASPRVAWEEAMEEGRSAPTPPPPPGEAVNEAMESTIPGAADSTAPSDVEVLKQDPLRRSPSMVAREGSSMRFGCLALVTTFGMVFGWALQRGAVSQPHNIRAQFIFERFVMLKMFLAASATGQLVIIVISVVPSLKGHFDFTRGGLYTICPKNGGRGIFASGVGGFLLGVGMAVGGACPGMVHAQIGAGVPNAWITLCGLLLGANLYGFFASWEQSKTIIHFRSVASFSSRKPNLEYVDDVLGVAYWKIALAMCVTMAAGVAVMEALVPWRDNLSEAERLHSYGAGRIFSWSAWPPSICGMIIGSIQFPMILTIGETLGSSTAFETLGYIWLWPSTWLQEKLHYMAKRVDSARWFSNWWQVFYAAGVIAGACASSNAGSTFGEDRGVTWPAALTGGVLMAFGSRFAGGCTSGHGLSGMALLSVLSFVAVPMMFAGGCLVGFVMEYGTGGYDVNSRDALF